MEKKPQSSDQYGVDKQSSKPKKKNRASPGQPMILP
jgi:hypothetical protein